jgi:gamma-glutamyltranspeptidase/glutathione hydrolase
MVEVARDILVRGGSAADAAVAAALTGGVTQPTSSGIGGGGFAVVWDARNKRVNVLDFREVAPHGLRASDSRPRAKLSDNLRGVMVGVPGELAGLSALHSRWGKLAFGEDVRAAAQVAERGFPVSAHLARSLQGNAAWVLASERLSFFARAGTLAGASDVVKNPSLATTLRRIASEGIATFYSGDIAADIVATASSAGSRITAKDLATYEVIERTPLHATWEGLDVYTMPPESAGGLMLVETLSMFSRSDLQALGFGTGVYLHVLAEAFRGAIADRVRSLGDPSFVRLDVAAMTDPVRMRARRARVRLDATTPAERASVDEAGTSHLVTVDEEGNVVSLTTTVNNAFGAKLVTKGGFVLNDELADFSSPQIERQFGVPPGRGPNSPRAGARPVSSMTPTIVVRDGTPVLALGGSGGMRIATATTQVLLARLVFGRAMDEAIAAPRIDTNPSGLLFIDTTAPREVIEDLGHRGEVVEAGVQSFSAVQGIALERRDGRTFLEPAADARKGGSSVVE